MRLAGMPFAMREHMCALISAHQAPFWLFEKDDQVKRALRMSVEMDTRLLIMHARADARGRVCADPQDIVQRVELSRLVFEELGVYATPIRSRTERAWSPISRVKTASRHTRPTKTTDAPLRSCPVFRVGQELLRGARLRRPAERQPRRHARATRLRRGGQPGDRHPGRHTKKRGHICAHAVTSYGTPPTSPSICAPRSRSCSGTTTRGSGWSTSKSRRRCCSSRTETARCRSLSTSSKTSSANSSRRSSGKRTRWCTKWTSNRGGEEPKDGSLISKQRRAHRYRWGALPNARA
jgi:hypothetical protein